MKGAGLKYISNDGLNFPAINGGKWNLASNYSFNYRRILSECSVDEEDDSSTILLFRYLTAGRMFYVVRRNLSESECYRGFDTLCVYVDNQSEIEPSLLASTLVELKGLLDHPEAFSHPEILEDSLPEIFHTDTLSPVEGERGERGDKIKRDIPGKGEIQVGKAMSGYRIGYIEYENEEELEVILSAGYNAGYENFGFILLSDNPVKVESSLPRLFLPELILHRQLSAPTPSFLEDEELDEEEKNALIQEETEDEDDNEEREEREERDDIEEREERDDIEEREENDDVEKRDGKDERAELGEDCTEEVGDRDLEESESSDSSDDSDSPEDPESSDRSETAYHPDDTIKRKYFLLGFLAATIIYLIIFAIYEAIHF